MTGQEIQQAIMFLNESWPQKPLGEATAGLWGAELAGHDARAVFAALMSLARTEEWRPSLAKILKTINRSRNEGKIGAGEVLDRRALPPGTGDIVSAERIAELYQALAERLARK